MARQSKIILCKNIKIDRDMKNVLSYTESQMLTLCNSNGIKVAEASNYSFIGKGDRDAITVSVSYATCLGCNYMAFQNYNYNNKWYFAFIDKVEYISEGATRLHYTVDIFSTWLDYWSNKACYILREHAMVDTIGSNTIDEGFGTGDYVIRSHLRDTSISNSTYWVIASTYNPELNTEDFGAKYNGLYSGVKYYAYGTASAVNTKITNIVEAEHGGMEAIQAVFTCPGFLIPLQDGAVVTDTAVATYDNTVSPITTIGSYVPKNKKVLTFPYTFIEVSNGVGGTSIIKQELFTATNQAGNYVFRVKGALCPGCSIRMYPRNYDGSEDNIDEGLTLGKYPICNFAGDIFTNWATQNAINIAVETGRGYWDLGAGAFNLAAGNMGGGSQLMSGAMEVAGVLDRIRKADLVPPQVKGNLNAGDVMFSSNELTFHVYKKTVKEEIAQAIDDYFSMYGYKTNRLKTANQMGRSNWNYVQIAPGETIGYQKDNVTAIPPADLVNINKLYQRGITLWHNHSTMGDYTQTNSIVS